MTTPAYSDEGYDKVIDEGTDDFKRGVPEHLCRYAPGDWRRDAWLTGWNIGCDDEIDHQQGRPCGTVGCERCQ